MSDSPYIDLLKKVLIDYHRMEMGETPPIKKNKGHKPRYWLLYALERILKNSDFTIREKVPFNRKKRELGLDWPAYADSMIGLKRMDNIEFCVNDTIKNNIPGDLIETGVWRGGSVIFMRALLKVAGVTDKNVWAADSFEGLPKPNAEKYAADKDDDHYTLHDILAISEETVRYNFEKYGLLDDQVKFLKGWFKDTFPTAPFEKLSVVRLDGDMYESTINGFDYLYPKLSVGGYLIVDDYGAVPGCKQAVHDYRQQHNITEEIIDIDGSGVYWKKLR
ncbi:MAG: class I SAM-dependent methyltransferase [Chitinophagaceae bacterium]|nr:class I SAM-dependent methyltransferase [Chitinophagaceae bacterium]